MTPACDAMPPCSGFVCVPKLPVIPPACEAAMPHAWRWRARSSPSSLPDTVAEVSGPNMAVLCSPWNWSGRRGTMRERASPTS